MTDNSESCLLFQSIVFFFFNKDNYVLLYINKLMFNISLKIINRTEEELLDKDEKVNDRT